VIQLQLFEIATLILVIEYHERALFEPELSLESSDHRRSTPFDAYP
jgi:hypothetical protein